MTTSRYDLGDGYYDYNTTNHLGNNRAVLNENGIVEQSTQYYPFGGIMGDLSTGPDVQHRKYNGKEYDHIHGLDWYDYGARSYDPALASWTSVDPLCEKYNDISPYVYCGDNPVNAFDPDGRDWYRNSNGTLLWSPIVNSQKNLQSGFLYVGKIYCDTKDGAFYRSDGSIYYKNEKLAYNRMWYLANRYWRTNKSRGGREESAFVLKSGAVLVMPDNWNDSQTSRHIGYKQEGNYIVNTKTNEKFAFLGQVHTHQAGGDSGLSRTPFPDDDDFCKSQPNKPVIVLEADGNISAGIYHKDKFIPLDDIGSLNNVLNGTTPLSLTMKMIIKSYAK